uniref:Uncharacterized protein n=1 Tax=Anguilla anguilla TaxID=7936 RepID=A0A0E9UQS9_ANGAN
MYCMLVHTVNVISHTLERKSCQLKIICIVL